jgi:hypothetical protein
VRILRVKEMGLDPNCDEEYVRVDMALDSYEKKYCGADVMEGVRAAVLPHQLRRMPKPRLGAGTRRYRLFRGAQ